VTVNKKRRIKKERKKNTYKDLVTYVKESPGGRTVSRLIVVLVVSLYRVGGSNLEHVNFFIYISNTINIPFRHSVVRVRVLPRIPLGLCSESARTELGIY
jgi:hypothetical protein